MINHCGSCIFWASNPDQCTLHKQLIDPALDFCSKHKEKGTARTCENCHGVIIDNSNSFLIMGSDSNYHELCGKCASLIGTCTTCSQVNYCKFETDSSPLPKVVQKQIRQGNMVINTTVKNPDRIKATCASGCLCWDNDKCKREDGNCKKYFHSYYSNS